MELGALLVDIDMFGPKSDLRCRRKTATFLLVGFQSAPQGSPLHMMRHSRYHRNYLSNFHSKNAPG